MGTVRKPLPGLKVACGTSDHFPLSRMQSHDHTELQGRLGDVVKVHVQEEEKWVLGDIYSP